MTENASTTVPVIRLGEVFQITGQAVQKYPEMRTMDHTEVARACEAAFYPRQSDPAGDPVAGDFLLDEPTAILRLGISRSTIYRWRRKGKIEAVLMQDSNMVRYRNSDIDAIIQARRQKAADYLQRPIAIAAGSR